jgi:hypothetical protein
MQMTGVVVHKLRKEATPGKRTAKTGLNQAGEVDIVYTVYKGVAIMKKILISRPTTLRNGWKWLYRRENGARLSRTSWNKKLTAGKKHSFNVPWQLKRMKP